MDSEDEQDDIAALLEDLEDEDGEDDEEEDPEEDAEEDAEEELEAAGEAEDGAAVAEELAVEEAATKSAGAEGSAKQEAVKDEAAEEAQKDATPEEATKEEAAKEAVAKEELRETKAEQEEELRETKAEQEEGAAPEAEVDSELERDAAGGMDAELMADLEAADGGGEDEDEAEDAEDDAEDANEEAEEENADGAKDADGAEDLGEEDGVEVAKPGRKQRGKPKDPNAPAKPANPYRQFCAEVRPKVMEERPELRSDLGALGKALAARWEEVPAEKKEEMQKSHEKEKAKYDELMVEYRKTESYKSFQKRFMAWSDSRETKKLQKKQKANAPKKPPTGFQAFGAVVRGEIARSFPGLSLSDLGKKVGERWTALSGKERQRYNTDSRIARERWENDMKAYRHTDGYRTAVDEMADLEVKQGMRQLKADYCDRVPKKSATAIQLFCTEASVRGTFAQRTAKFRELPEEDQRKYAEEAAKLATKSKDVMAAFLDSKEGQIYTRKAANIKQKAKIRAARLKFLVDAPKRPLNAKALFTQRKREELETSEGDAGEGSAAVAAKAAKQWEGMGEAERRPFEEEAARLAESYEKALADFKESTAYQELKVAERKAGGVGRGRATAKGRGKARAKAKAEGRGKAKAKGKAKARAKASSLVARPESMPAKPPNIYQLFCKEQQALGKPITRAAFASVSEDDNKRLNAELLRLHKQYSEDMAKFMNSKDGKRYKRQLDSAAQKQKARKVKEKIKEAEPTKPLTAFRLFVAANKGTVGGGRPAERWAKMSPEERQKWEQEHEKQMADYQKAMADFQKSATYKKLQRAAIVKKGAPSTPTSMPKRPMSSPYFFFIKDLKDTGKSLGKEGTAKAWAEMGPEGQQKYVQQAKTAMVAWQEEMNRWRQTAEGKKTMKVESRMQKKRTEEKIKEKHLKAPNAPEPPQKPKSAKMIFLDERRKQLLKEQGGAAGGPREMAARLVKEWEGLTAEGRKVWDNKERSLLDVYEFEMDEYKNSEAYKKYTNALKSKGIAKAQAKKAAGGKRKGDDLSFDSSDEMGSDTSSDTDSD